MFCICICMIELNFEEQIENKLEVNSNRKNVTRNVTPNSTGRNFLIPISKFCVLPTVRKVTKLSRNFEEQIENKLEVKSNRKNVTRNVTLNSTGRNFHIPISKFCILPTIRKVTKLSRILVFKVPPESIWNWA
jgi:hypothetical protein